MLLRNFQYLFLFAIALIIYYIATLPDLTLNLHLTPSQTITTFNNKTFNFLTYTNNTKNQLFGDYITYHTQVVSGLVKPNFLVIQTSPRVGIGNRLEEIQAGLLLAVLSGRAVLVDWMEPFPVSDMIDTMWPVMWHYTAVFPEGRGNLSFLEVDVKGELIKDWFKSDTPFSTITENIIWLTYPNMMHFPYQIIYDHPLYADTIPTLLGEWKTTLTANFVRPIQPIMEKIDILKKSMSPYDAIITVHIRTEMIFWWSSIPYSDHEKKIPYLVQKHLDCVNYFKNQLETKQGKKKVKIYITTDQPLVFTMAHNYWNTSVHHITQKPMHTANVGDHYTKQQWINNQADEFYNVMIDWWMIGEGEVMVVSDRSSFSFTAAARSGKRRFTVGEFTQCMNDGEKGYLEEIYVPTWESWKKEGRMIHKTLQ